MSNHYVLGYPDADAMILNKPRVAFGPFGDFEEAVMFMIKAKGANASIVAFEDIPAEVPVISLAQAERYYDHFTGLKQ